MDKDDANKMGYEGQKTYSKIKKVFTQKNDESK